MATFQELREDLKSYLDEKQIKKIHEAYVLGKEAHQFENLEHILAQFENFCTVSQSVQAGIPLTIHVEDSTGTLLK